MGFLSSSSLLTRRVISYFLIAFVVFAAINTLGWFAYLTYKNHYHPTFSFSENPAGPLPEKKAWYLAHKNEYGALFLGDSRTLCGMHPDFIDLSWNRTSYNLSHWATWMPMQQALISDIVNDIPKDTVVVWSIGHENFRKQVIRAVYPLSWIRIPSMAMQGYPLGELINAQLAFTPITVLIGRREEFFAQLETILGRVVVKPSASVAGSTISSDKTLERVQDKPGTAYVEPWRDEQGRLVSIAQYKTNGAMARIILAPEYYRGKQEKKDFTGFTMESFTPDDASLASFKKIVDMFDKAGVTLIVNEIEESPYMYKDKAAREEFRRWMRTTIKPVAEEHGFKYVHADEANLKDSDYFDYNHMNEAGAKKYNRVLGRKLFEATR